MKAGVVCGVFCLLVCSTVIGKELSLHEKQWQACFKVPVKEEKICYKDIEVQEAYPCKKPEKLCTQTAVTRYSQCQRVLKAQESYPCEDKYETQCIKVPETATCHKTIMTTKPYSCKSHKKEEECREVVRMSKSTCERATTRSESYNCKREEEAQICKHEKSWGDCVKQVKVCPARSVKPKACLYTKEVVPSVCKKETHEPYDCSTSEYRTRCRDSPATTYPKSFESHSCVGKGCRRLFKDVGKFKPVKRKGKLPTAGEVCERVGELVLVPKTCYKKVMTKTDCSKVVKRKCDWKEIARERAASCKWETVKYQCEKPKKRVCEEEKVMKNAVCERKVPDVEQYKCKKPVKRMECTLHAKAKTCYKKVPEKKRFSCKKFKEKCKQVKVKPSKVCYRDVDQVESYRCPKTTQEERCFTHSKGVEETCYRLVKKQAAPYDCSEISYKCKEKAISWKNGKRSSYQDKHKHQELVTDVGQPAVEAGYRLVGSKRMKAKRGKVDVSIADQASNEAKHAARPRK